MNAFDLGLTKLAMSVWNPPPLESVLHMRLQAHVDQSSLEVLNDRDVVDYLLQVAGDTDTDVETLATTLASFIPELSDEDGKASLIANELLSDLAPPTDDSCESGSSSPPQIIMKSLANSVTLDQDSSESSQSEPVSLLVASFPDFPKSHIEQALRLHPEPNDAAEYLLAVSMHEAMRASLDQAVAKHDFDKALQSEQARRKQGLEAMCRPSHKEEGSGSANIDKSVKQTILNRFEDEVVVEGRSNGKHSKRQQLKQARRDSKKDRSSVDSGLRFLDGQTVKVSKGAKYVVEDLTPEWDGGSRGRVKTKGKRGTGWA